MNRKARSGLLVGMGLIKSRHGVWLVRQKVPRHLEEPVARVLGRDKGRQAYLQESTRTKNKIEAKRIAVAALAGFQDTQPQAEALVAARPLRTALSRPDMRHNCKDALLPWMGLETAEHRARAVAEFDLSMTVVGLGVIADDAVSAALAGPSPP